MENDGIKNPDDQAPISNKVLNPKPKNYDLIVYWDLPARGWSAFGGEIEI